MTLQEFKSWFEGFTENMQGPPNTEQWKRVQERVKQIDGTAVTERIFIDRYWNHWHWHSPSYYGPVYSPAPVYTPTVTCSSLGDMTGTTSFNSTSAMHALGQQEMTAFNSIAALGQQEMTAVGLNLNA
jgi:hypothetical protein